MNKKQLRNIITVLLLQCMCLSCVHNSREEHCNYRFIVRVPEGISIDKSELESALGYQEECGKAAEIVVYYFSTGREVFSYSTDSGDDVRQTVYMGSMEVLLKTRENGIIKDVYFIKSEGDSKAGLIKEIISKARAVLCE